MRSEKEASSLKDLLSEWAAQIPSAVVKLSFENGDGFALRVHEGVLNEQEFGAAKAKLLEN